MRLGATDLKPLSIDDVALCNSEAEAFQVWGTGIVKNFVLGTGLYTIEVKLDPDAKLSQRITFHPNSLTNGSQILPPGFGRIL